MERELDVELRFHVERLTEDYVRDGLSPSEARRRARLEFGGVEQIKEECRDARGTRWFHELVQDLTFSARLLTKERLFTCAAVAALGLGIGINNMLFTIVNASCIRGLPIAGVSRIAYLESRDGQRDGGLSGTATWRRFDRPRKPSTALPPLPPLRRHWPKTIGRPIV